MIATVQRLTRSKSDLVKPAPAVNALGVVDPLPIEVSCSAFEGTLSALFLCVREHKVDLADIPIAPICQSYFQYLTSLESANLDEAAAALAALAYLIERKAWSLLPTSEPEPDEEDLDSVRLLESSVAEFAECIGTLEVFRQERERLYFRTEPDWNLMPSRGLDLMGFGIEDLASALAEMIALAQPELPASLDNSRRNLGDVMRETLVLLNKGWQPLIALLPDKFTVSAVVYVFLALLEFIRLGQVSFSIDEGGVQFAQSVS